jgi:hypothetical protein
MKVICVNGHIYNFEDYSVHEDDWELEKLSKIRCPDCRQKVELYLSINDKPITKEIIIADADNSDYVHSERFETTFKSEYYVHNIFTERTWSGKVKITIEPYEENKHD